METGQLGREHWEKLPLKERNSRAEIKKRGECWEWKG